jgi:hypothetical protein
MLVMANGTQTLRCQCHSDFKLCAINFAISSDTAMREFFRLCNGKSRQSEVELFADNDNGGLDSLTKGGHALPLTVIQTLQYR